VFALDDDVDVLLLVQSTIRKNGDVDPLRETLIKATLPGFFVREAATPKFASS
jgi:hypothetical protein